MGKGCTAEFQFIVRMLEFFALLLYPAWPLGCVYLIGICC